MNPLGQIRMWFLSLPHEAKTEITILSSRFHLDNTISSEHDIEIRVSKFIAYLDSSGLKPIEIVQRTIFISKLLDIILENRKTENDWIDAMDTLLDIRNEATKEDDTTCFIDRSLQSLPARKDMYLNICKDWEELYMSKISNREIMNWYVRTLQSK
jgi:hypothetical protein